VEVGHVGELWRYPFKSMGSERIASAALTSAGILGDRCWAVRDEVLGGIRGAKKFSGLMRCQARFVREPDGPGDDGVVEITMPDGTTVSTTDDTASARLSAVLDHEVSVWPRQPAEDLDHYRVGQPTQQDVQAELRSIFALTEDEPLPNFRRLPSDPCAARSMSMRRYQAPTSTPSILVVTTASLNAMRRLRPDAVIDVRRFRPNIVVNTDASLTGPVEHDWEGRTLNVGTVELELTWRCPRCVMITHGFGDIPTDRSLMRTVVRQFGQELGIYAVVARPGQLREGDDVVLI
jgi:MOSC domain-containing protein